MAAENGSKRSLVKVLTVHMKIHCNQQVPSMHGIPELERYLEEGWVVDRADGVELGGEQPKEAVIVYILRRLS